MNGPEHYELAEDLLDESWEARGSERSELVSAALVHATLAHAAAVAAQLSMNPATSEYGVSREWKRALTEDAS